MKDLSGKNFGILIAYIVPGAIVLIGLSAFSPMVQAWLINPSESQPSIGGFLFVTLPTSLIATTTLKLNARLAFTASNGPINGTASARIVLSPDESSADGVLNLASITRKIKLNTGKTKTFDLKIVRLIPQTLRTGSYHVLIETTDTAGDSFTTDSGKTLSSRLNELVDDPS